MLPKLEQFIEYSS